MVTGRVRVVRVGRVGRYRGLAVRQLSLRDGWATGTPLSRAEDAGVDLGLRGSARWGDRDQRIPVEELVDVQEEITVVYRRSAGSPKGGRRVTVFGDIGGFVRLGAVWFPGGRRGAEYGGHFLIRFSEPSEYGSWQGVGEVEWWWSLVRSKGWIALEPWAVDEAVRVSRWGRYRGLPVIQFGPVKDNTLAVSPESYDPRAGRDDDHVHG